MIEIVWPWSNLEEIDIEVPIKCQYVYLTMKIPWCSVIMYLTLMVTLKWPWSIAIMYLTLKDLNCGSVIIYLTLKWPWGNVFKMYLTFEVTLM